MSETETDLDVGKAKKQQAAQNRKAKAEIESVLEDAAVVAERAALERALLEVEAAGYDLVQNREKWDEEALCRAIELRAAESRSVYANGFSVTDERKAAWAAAKISEARTALEDAKHRMKMEVNRCERAHEARKAFFEAKVEAFAKTIQRETSKCPECKGKGQVFDPVKEQNGQLVTTSRSCEKCGGTGRHLSRVAIRSPEHGVRIELRPSETGGTKILDSEAATRSLLDYLGKQAEDLLGMPLDDQQRAENGLLEAYRLGLVRVTMREKEFLEFHEGAGQPRIDGVEVTPVVPGEKLTIVRM